MPTGGRRSSSTQSRLTITSQPVSRKGELDRMRRSNAEWDFMGRSFLVWSLAEMALREPARKEEFLAVMDQIIAETLELERERGMHFFLMPYSKASPYVAKPERSLRSEEHTSELQSH